MGVVPSPPWTGCGEAGAYPEYVHAVPSSLSCVNELCDERGFRPCLSIVIGGVQMRWPATGP